MTVFSPGDRLTAVTADEWRLVCNARQGPGELMLHDTAERLGMEPGKLFACLGVLAEDGLADLYMLVHHPKTSPEPGRRECVYRRPFNAGFPQVPAPCPVCGEFVREHAELRFGVSCWFKGPVRFEEGSGGA